MDPSIFFVIALVVALLAGLVGGAFRNWFVVGLATIFAGIALWLFAGAAVVLFVTGNWPLLLGGVAGYLVLGILYGIFRHWRHVNSEPVQQLLRKWKAEGSDDLHFPRTARPDRDALISHIAWWPLSIIFYFFGDVLRDLFVGIYNKIAGVFTAITDAAVRRAGGE